MKEVESGDRVAGLTRIQSKLLGEHSALTERNEALGRQVKMLWDALTSLQKRDQEVLANMEEELGRTENRVQELDSTVSKVMKEKNHAVTFLDDLQSEHEV